MENKESYLVEHLAQLQNQVASQQTQNRVAAALLDWFTAGWSARNDPRAQQLYKLAAISFPPQGSSGVFSPVSTCLSALGAAFANAGITHINEIDDAHRSAMLHPGIVSISPVLALAAEHSLTYSQISNAIVAGYDISIRAGRALGPDHAGNFHVTATAGSLGAAAATATALKLTQSQLHHALGLAATQAAGLWQFVDDHAHASKPLHPAFAVRNGMMAAFAAQLGYPGASAFLTGKRGMYALLKGKGPLDALLPVADEPALIHTTTIKAWPCCAQLFTALDAIQELIGQHSLQAQDIDHITINIFSNALRIAGVNWPTTVAEAPFCLPYLVSLLILTQGISLEKVQSQLFLDQDIQAFSKKITIISRDDYQKYYPDKRICDVNITLSSSSQRLTASKQLRRGDPELAFTWDELQQRMSIMVPSIDAEKKQEIIAWCENFSNPDNMNRVCQPSQGLF